MNDRITESMQTLAGDAFDAFETATRPDGETTFVRLKDNAPDWVQPIVYAAHGDLLPDDWRYDCAWSAFGAIHDASEDADISEVSHEFADGHADIYTAARFDWLSSNLERQGYVDEAARQFGPADDVAAAVGMGQYLEAQEVFNTVAEKLAELSDDEDEDEGEDE